LIRHSAPRGVGRAAGALVAAALLLLTLVLPVGAVEGPTKLYDVSVTPRDGSPTTVIAFAVSYRNREGSAPSFVRVVIDGTAHDMASSGGSNWKKGVPYHYSMKLPAGSHQVRFEASDTRKFSHTIDGGSVTITVAPAPKPTPKPTPDSVTESAPDSEPASTPKPTPAPDSMSGPAPGPATTTQPSSETSTGRTDGWGGVGGADDSGAGSTTTPGGGPTSPVGGTGTGELTNGRRLDPGVALIVAAGGADPGQGPGGTPDDLPGTSGAGSGAQDSSVGGWAAAADALGLEGDWSSLRAIPTLVGTAGAATMALAFALFGKKRRDEAPPAPDEVLHANSARGVGTAASAELVPPAAPADLEAAMPRWRRPSLLEARKADPTRMVATTTALSFGDHTVAVAEGRERRVIRYRVVRLLDAPDELRSVEIGQVDQGDEVELIERSGAYWFVLCPDGRQGWLHKMTLGDVVGENPSPTAGEAWGAEEVDNDVLTAFLSARART
jgi:hypothetical protein